MTTNAPLIAIPEPTSTDPNYNARSWPQYAEAVERSGGKAVRIPLSASPAEAARMVSECSGVLLPGSPADVNPQKYGQDAISQCAAADPAREAVDELLLQDAFNLHKPLLCICYGAQSLNVWKGGTLIQHLATGIDHKAGREIVEAHPVKIASNTRLKTASDTEMVNSSHHQAIATPGDALNVVAAAPDGTIEAVEQPGSFYVLGVQWHPERTYAESALSKAIFQDFVDASAAWEPRAIHESVAR